jgi:zinc/manganese transport system permease protein
MVAWSSSGSPSRRLTTTTATRTRIRTPAEMGEPRLSWSPAHDLGALLEYHFMVNALLAAGIVAATAGAVGWMMVLRRQAFAGHTLSMMAFPGASAAALAGVPAAWGYFAFCGAGALAIGRSGTARRTSWIEQGAATGVFQAVALAIGFLFVSLYGGVLGDLETLLFGDVLGISDGELLGLGLLAAAALATLVVIARPLVFASVDPDVARARGVPVGGLSLAFFALLGLTVAATSLITGPLLVFALLVAPAAGAQAITARPLLSLVLSIVLALTVAWLGLAISYFSVYPAGVFIAGLAFLLYLLARAAAALRARGVSRPRPGEPVPEGVIA